MEKKKKFLEAKQVWKNSIILLCIASLGLSACGLKSTIAATPTSVFPTFPTPIVETLTLQSIDETQFISTNTVVLSSTPLKMDLVNGVPIQIEDPPIPCGQPPVYSTPDLTAPQLIVNYERDQLCNNIMDIARLLKINLSQQQVEQLAEKMIIVSPQDVLKLCGEKAGACYHTIAKKIILNEEPDEFTILHEDTHSLLLSDSKFLDTNTDTCFLINPSGGFVMTYKNQASTTGWSTIFISQELIPSISEMLLIKAKQQGGNFNLNYPAYLIGSHSDENIKDQLRSMFDGLDFSLSEHSFLLTDSPITMTSLFNWVETVTDGPDNLAQLSDKFSLILTGTEIDRFQTYTPIQNSSVTATEACR